MECFQKVSRNVNFSPLCNPSGHQWTYYPPPYPNKVWNYLSDSSSLPGPDVESFTTEISLQVPTQAELRHKLSSLSSTCTDSASQDTEAGEEDDEEEDEENEQGGSGGGGGGRRRRPPVVVTLDEEEVHPDTALVDQEDQNSKDCEESRPKVWGGMDWISPQTHKSNITILASFSTPFIRKKNIWKKHWGCTNCQMTLP